MLLIRIFKVAWKNIRGVFDGVLSRFRSVLMTALIAALKMLPTSLVGISFLQSTAKIGRQYDWNNF